MIFFSFPPPPISAPSVFPISLSFLPFQPPYPYHHPSFSPISHKGIKKKEKVKEKANTKKSHKYRIHILLSAYIYKLKKTLVGRGGRGRGGLFFGYEEKEREGQKSRKKEKAKG